MRADENLEETTFSFSEEAPRPPERRTALRHLTILRVGSLIIEGKRELCLIRNISAGGLMAHVYTPLAEGQRVEVELKSDQRIAGSVYWARESNIGIGFDAPIDVEEMLASHKSGSGDWRPRMPRIEVDRLAMMRVGARAYGVSTCDISQGGVKLIVDQPLEPGAAVVLSLEQFRAVPGVVRWYHEGVAGIAFNEVIPFQELMAWLRGRQERAARHG